MTQRPDAAGYDPGAVLESVRRWARVTPLLPAPELSERCGAEIHLKLESLQRTGSFKVRGAAARLAALDAEERQRGVVACSSGNHGRAVAWVAREMGIPASIYVPAWVDPVKLEGIRRFGAQAVLAGKTFDEAEARALEEARSTGRCYVSAYDDPWVIAGQGTLTLEIEEQLGEAPAALLAPLSGGGLLGGMSAALRARGGSGVTATELVGVSAARAAVMVASLDAGRPVDLPEEDTLASALAGGIGLDNRHSFALVRDGVTRHVVVDEAEIETAVRYAFGEVGLVVEGGGAVGLAALLSGRWSPARGPVVVVVSGGNIALETLSRVLQGDAR